MPIATIFLKICRKTLLLRNQITQIATLLKNIAIALKKFKRVKNILSIATIFLNCCRKFDFLGPKTGGLVKFVERNFYLVFVPLIKNNKSKKNTTHRHRDSTSIAQTH